MTAVILIIIIIHISHFSSLSSSSSSLRTVLHKLFTVCCFCCGNVWKHLDKLMPRWWKSKQTFDSTSRDNSERWTSYRNLVVFKVMAASGEGAAESPEILHRKYNTRWHISNAVQCSCSTVTELNCHFSAVGMRVVVSGVRSPAVHNFSCSSEAQWRCKKV